MHMVMNLRAVLDEVKDRESERAVKTEVQLMPDQKSNQLNAVLVKVNLRAHNIVSHSQCHFCLHQVDFEFYFKQETHNF